MQRPTYGISLGNYYRKRPWHGRDRASRTQLARFHVCSSLAPRPMTVVFGLGMRLRVRMHTALENGVLRNRQQVRRAENSFINQDEFVAMKMLSGCKTLRCDKHQFRDKMTVRT